MKREEETKLRQFKIALDAESGTEQRKAIQKQIDARQGLIRILEKKAVDLLSNDKKRLAVEERQKTYQDEIAALNGQLQTAIGTASAAVPAAAPAAAPSQAAPAAAPQPTRPDGTVEIRRGTNVGRVGVNKLQPGDVLTGN
jgi:hypothetical protein